MNQSQSLQALADQLGGTKGEARQLLDRLCVSVTKAAKKGEEFVLPGLGKFVPNRTKARKARNPQTGETIKVAAKKVLKFKSSKELKTALN